MVDIRILRLAVIGLTGVWLVFLGNTEATAQDSHPIACPEAGTEFGWEINDKGAVSSAGYLFKGGEGFACSYTAMSTRGHRDETRFYMFCNSMTEIDCNGHRQLGDLWSMKVDNRATYTFQKHMGNGVVADMIATYKVEAYEDVTTKAGTFKAYRIKENIDSVAGSYHGAFYVWYAPEMKFIVKAVQGKLDGNEAQLHSGLELAKYKLPPR